MSNCIDLREVQFVLEQARRAPNPFAVKPGAQSEPVALYSEIAPSCPNVRG